MYCDVLEMLARKANVGEEEVEDDDFGIAWAHWAVRKEACNQFHHGKLFILYRKLEFQRLNGRDGMLTV